MMNTARGLKTGDLVTVPAGRGRRHRVVVESMSADGSRFTGTRGAVYPAAGAELVPLADAALTSFTAPCVLVAGQ